MARAILSRLRNVPLGQVWRTVVEGGLMEARLGRLTTARHIFQYLMSHMRCMSPIYCEYARIDELWGRFSLALRTVEIGIMQIPRAVSLWFMALRLLERTSTDLNVPRSHAKQALQHLAPVSVNEYTHTQACAKRSIPAQMLNIFFFKMLRCCFSQHFCWSGYGVEDAFRACSNGRAILRVRTCSTCVCG